MAKFIYKCQVRKSKVSVPLRIVKIMGFDSIFVENLRIFLFNLLFL